MNTRPSSVGPFDKAIADALRGKAAELHLTQIDIANASGITARTIHRYMNGQSPIPVSKLVDIASAIGVDPGEIINAARTLVKRHEQNTSV